jgi:hypothetical protein
MNKSSFYTGAAYNPNVTVLLRFYSFFMIFCSYFSREFYEAELIYSAMDSRFCNRRKKNNEEKDVNAE